MRNNFLDSDIWIKAREGVPVQELSDDVTMVLRAARRLHPGEDIEFFN
jgi:hypothetical protein